MRADNLLPLVVLVASACSGSAKKPPAVPGAGVTDPWKPKIAAQVKPYLDHELVTGMVVGVVDGDRNWVYGFGRVGNTDKAPGGRTIFELGTITKVYTALLYADALERKEVEPSTPVSTLLPMGVVVPAAGDRVITLEQLVTHRSGLPSIPPGLVAKQLSPDPYAGYKPEALFRDLARTRLLFPPGTNVAFSTYGTGLLGLALARKSGAASYSAAIATRVLGPLGLRDTSQHVPAGQSARHATGHDDDGKVVPFWSFDALAGSGGLRSTAIDQLRFLRANIDAANDGKGPLANSLRRIQEVIVPGDPHSLALGWFVDGKGRRWHSGQTGGFHAYIAFDPERRQGIVILAATATVMLDRLGTTLVDVLAGETPLPIALPAADQLATYAGSFKVGSGTGAFDLLVTLDGKKLHAKSGSDPAFRLLPVTSKEFYVEKIQMRVVFEDADHVVLELDGKKVLGTRVAGAPAPAPAPAPSPKP